MRWIHQAKGSYETGRNGLVESIIKITGRSFFFSFFLFFFPSFSFLLPMLFRLISTPSSLFTLPVLCTITVSLGFVASLFLEKGTRIHFHIARMDAVVGERRSSNECSMKLVWFHRCIGFTASSKFREKSVINKWRTIRMNKLRNKKHDVMVR